MLPRSLDQPEFLPRSYALDAGVSGPPDAGAPGARQLRSEVLLRRPPTLVVAMNCPSVGGEASDGQRARRAGGRAAVLLAVSAVWLASGATPSVAGGTFLRPCPVISYHTAPTLRAQRVCMNLNVVTHGTQPGTYLFLAPGGDSGTGAGIYRDNGQLVWWQPAVAPRIWNVQVVRYQGQSYLAEWAGHVIDNGHHESGTIYLY